MPQAYLNILTLAGLVPATHAVPHPHSAQNEHAPTRQPLTHPTHGPAWMAGTSPAKVAHMRGTP